MTEFILKHLTFKNINISQFFGFNQNSHTQQTGLFNGLWIKIKIYSKKYDKLLFQHTFYLNINIMQNQTVYMLKFNKDNGYRVKLDEIQKDQSQIITKIYIYIKNLYKKTYTQSQMLLAQCKISLFESSNLQKQDQLDPHYALGLSQQYSHEIKQMEISATGTQYITGNSRIQLAISKTISNNDKSTKNNKKTQEQRQKVVIQSLIQIKQQQFLTKISKKIRIPKVQQLITIKKQFNMRNNVQQLNLQNNQSSKISYISQKSTNFKTQVYQMLQDIEKFKKIQTNKEILQNDDDNTPINMLKRCKSASLLNQKLINQKIKDFSCVEQRYKKKLQLKPSTKLNLDQLTRIQKRLSSYQNVRRLNSCFYNLIE